ncbi:hypothetical protein JX265_002625 [Neoarthrinium moseri]|uniref:Uncharacterized protein n=1 Tax=Neoarthrinium moseri TaxID=1658444 RepID=A0A9Q0AUY9_9PEZI|nr:hypothetical protein JX265_002625 [Neoarthrinium moseri]
MDVNQENPETQLGVNGRQLRRLSRRLRPATARGLRNGLNSSLYSQYTGCWKYSQHAQAKINARVNRSNRQRKAANDSCRWAIDNEDGASLARSNLWLPSDGSRQKPQLKRQEAFRVPEMVFVSDVIENDSDLYRLGLLYDDEHARGSGFDLNAIVHSDPVYAIRPAKRTRKSRCNQCTSGGNFDKSLWLDLPIDEDLSLAELLSAEFGGTSAAINEPTPIQDRQVDLALPTPLHIIYELTESSTHSLAARPARRHVLDTDSCSDEEDCDGWNVVPLLRREDSGLTALTDDSEDNPDAATAEAWIMLGET